MKVLTIPLKEMLFFTPKTGAKPLPLFLTLLLGVLFWYCPVPQGLDVSVWRLFGIFVATIFGVIMKPLPMGAVALISMTFLLTSKLLTLEQGLASFSSKIVWLVLLAFFIAKGFVKTGLGSRVAYLFIAAFGKSSLGLAYSLSSAELLLAPAVPSNTARGAGILFPIIKSLAKEQGSDPKLGTERHLGAYLLKVMFHTNLTTSAMFLTALAGNPLIASLAKPFGIHITWSSWAMAAIVPGMISLCVVPYVLYKLYPPKLLHTPKAPLMAKEKLAEMGALTFQEKTMCFTFIGLLILWVFGGFFGINATVAAMVGLSVLLLSGVLSFEDLLQEKAAWATLIWFAILLTMANVLTERGFVTWFSNLMSTQVQGTLWPLALFFLGSLYYYSHYFFASATAHISAMYGAFLGVMLASGVPPYLAAMSLAVMSNLCGGLTHYGTGTAPVYFGAGYIPVSKWWQLGAILSVVHISIWSLFGGVWWKVLGLW